MEIIVYCSENNCPQSESVASRLIGLGYKNVSILDGGFDEWLRHHYPAQIGVGGPPKPRSEAMTVEQAIQKIVLKQIIVLDVRPASEFTAGHLPEARSVPLEGLDSSLAHLTKDQDILVYDRRSDRSQQATQKLMNAGFKTFELSGGLAEWIKKGRRLEVK